MPSDEAYQELEDENAVLRARIDELERALFADAPVPLEWRLTAQEARVVGVLLQRPMATKEAVMATLYRNDGKDEAEIKIVDVFICKARKKLAPFGIRINTIWGQGYSIDESIRQRVHAGEVEITS